jgi:hypothetical protein
MTPHTKLKKKKEEKKKRNFYRVFGEAKKIQTKKQLPWDRETQRGI